MRKLLGLPAPAYWHHPLLVGEDGRRFAKRDKARTLAEMRAAGLTAAAVRALAGYPD